jgi:hypothetical protein
MATAVLSAAKITHAAANTLRSIVIAATTDTAPQRNAINTPEAGKRGSASRRVAPSDPGRRICVKIVISHQNVAALIPLS